MFRRRQKISVANRVRDVLWPRLGWRRYSRYTLHRLARLPGTPHSIAAGFACGVAMSFTPLVGAHVLLALLVSWLIGGSLLSALIGTIIGNPWTFPFIWLWIYNVGLWLGIAAGDAGRADFGVFFSDLIDASLRMDMNFIADRAWPILAPMLAGGAITALGVWLAFYFFLKPVLKAYQNKGVRRHVPAE
jgi:uncharacterized protein